MGIEGDKKIKKAARTVIFDGGKLAIIEVRGGEYYKIPGGGIEKGEDEIQAAKREAKEEAGCEVEIVKKIGEQEFIDPEDDKVIHYSVCFLAKRVGEKKSPSFDEWEITNDFKLYWVDFDEAINLFQSSKTRDIFGREINNRDLEFLISAVAMKDLLS